MPSDIEAGTYTLKLFNEQINGDYKIDYVFGGWYTKDGTNDDWGAEFTALSIITEATTVYAKWLEKVTFEVEYTEHIYQKDTERQITITPKSISKFDFTVSISDDFALHFLYSSYSFFFCSDRFPFSVFSVSSGGGFVPFMFRSAASYKISSLWNLHSKPSLSLTFLISDIRSAEKTVLAT